MLTPFPGTMLYERLKSENRLLSDTFWNKCTLFDATFVPKSFTVQEFEHGFERLMISVYSKENLKERKAKFRKILKARSEKQKNAYT